MYYGGFYKNTMFNVETDLNDEYFTNLDPEEILDIKKLSTEDKALAFRYFLDSDVITNASVIFNLFILVNGITDIDDNAMDDERIFFSSLEEYVDIKLQIRYELDDFNTWLVEYYLGIIEGLDTTLDELKSHIPNTAYNVMALVTPSLISRLMTKYLMNVNASKVKPAFNANELYNKINNTNSLITTFMQNVANEVGNNENDNK